MPPGRRYEKNLMFRSLRFTAAAAALLLALPVHATNVLRFEGYGAVSRAMGGTGMAYDIGTAALMTNPATMSLINDSALLEAGTDLVMTNPLRMTNEATGETATSRHRSPSTAYYAPQVGLVRRSGDLTLGMGIYAGSGVGTDYGPGTFLSRTPGGIMTGFENSSRLFVVEMPVGASWRVNERLTLGAAISGVWAGMNLQTLFGGDQVRSLIGSGRMTGSLVSLVQLIPGLDGAQLGFEKGNDVGSAAETWGWSGRLGLTWRVSDQTRIGAAYSTRTHLGDLTGRARLTAISSLLGQVPLDGKVAVRNLQIPDLLTVGISHQATDSLLLAADVSRVRWGRVWKDIRIAFDADNGAGNLAVRLPQDYRDITVLSLGAAYRVAPWTFRAGAAVADLAPPPETLAPVLPQTPLRHLSLGATYDAGRVGRFNLAYSRGFTKTLHNASLPNVSPTAPLRIEHGQHGAVISYSLGF